MLRTHIFRATSSTSRNFNFVTYEEKRRITKDIHAETNFSGELSEIHIHMYICVNAIHDINALQFIYNNT